MTRHYYIDNASAILLFYMILSHAATAMHMTKVVEPLSFVFMFFMAWFFFKSGMLRKERDAVEELMVCSRTLLIPFCSFSLFAVLIRMPFAIIVNHESTFQIVKVEIVRLFYSNGPMWNSPLWFLLSLFSVKILYSFLRGIGGRDILIAGASILLAIISGHYFNGLPVDPGYILMNPFCGMPKLPLIIGNLPVAMAFYTLGGLLKDKQFNKWLVMASAFVFSIHFFVPFTFDFRTNSCSGPYWFAFISLLAGCICFNKVCSVLLNHHLGIITDFGEHSLVYYVLHFPLLMVVVQFFASYSGMLSFGLVLVCLFAVLYFACKLLYSKPLRVIIGR